MSRKTQICMKHCQVNNMNINDSLTQTGFGFNIGITVPGQILPDLLLPLPSASSPRLIQPTPDVPLFHRWFVGSFNFGPLIFDALQDNPSNPNADPNDNRSFFWSLNSSDQLILNPGFGGPFFFPPNVAEGQQFILRTINMSQQTRYLRIQPDRTVIGVANPAMGTPLQLFDLTRVPVAG